MAAAGEQHRPLPPSYRFDSHPSTALRLLPQIYAGLITNPEVYWSKNRTVETLEKQVRRAWRCVCVVRDDAERVDGVEELCAFARIISDGVEFAYLSDVVVFPAHQKKGIAKAIVQEAIHNAGEVPGDSTTWKWFLWTKDAHSLYHSVGFAPNTNGRALERAVFPS